MEATEQLVENEEQVDALFTRGRPGDEDNRGSSMVQKHFEKLQQEKEDSSMAKLQGLMPQLGPVVRMMALEENDWCVEKAALLLRKFQVANFDDLTQLHKKRKRILSSIQAGSTKRSRKSKDREYSNSPEGSKSAGDASLDSEAEKVKHREKKKAKESRSPSPHPKQRHKGKSSKRSKSSKSSKHKKKKEKDKKHSKDKKKGSERGMYQYGKYGVIRESDLVHKRSEFVAWALDEKNIDVESLPRQEEKALFLEYAEDYNTGTLPHRRYYDLEVYMRQKLEKASSSGKVKRESGRERLTFNDEEDRRRELQQERVKQQQDRVREAYQEMRNTEKADDMRQQEILRMQLSLAYKTGDTKAVEKLADRLRPDDSKEGRKNLDQ